MRPGDLIFAAGVPFGTGRHVVRAFCLWRTVLCRMLVLLILCALGRVPAGGQEVSRVALRNFRLGLRAIRTGDERVADAAGALARAIASAGLSGSEAERLAGPRPWTLGTLLDGLALDPRLQGEGLSKARRAYAEARRQYARAVTVFETIERMAPAFVDAPLMRGLALLCLGETDAALAALQKARQAGITGVRVLRPDGLLRVFQDGVTAARLPEIGAALAGSARWPALGSGVPGTPGYRFGYGSSGVRFDFDEAGIALPGQQDEQMDLFAEIDASQSAKPLPPPGEAPGAAPPAEQKRRIEPRPAKARVRAAGRRARATEKPAQEAVRPAPTLPRRSLPQPGVSVAWLSRAVSTEDSINALRALELGRRELLRGKNTPGVAQARMEAEDRLNRGLRANRVTRAVLREMFPEFPVPLNTLWPGSTAKSRIWFRRSGEALGKIQLRPARPRQRLQNRVPRNPKGCG